MLGSSKFTSWDLWTVLHYKISRCGRNLFGVGIINFTANSFYYSTQWSFACGIIMCFRAFSGSEAWSMISVLEWHHMWKICRMQNVDISINMVVSSIVIRYRTHLLNLMWLSWQPYSEVCLNMVILCPFP